MRTRRQPPQGSWCLDDVAGRLVELSAGASPAALTAVAGLLLEAQRRDEPAAWIAARRSTFFPPDLAATGIDLDALPVIRAGRATRAARAADTLLRSGGVALVVLDLARGMDLSTAVQARLAGLAQRHRAAVLCLTRKPRDAASLGSLVSLRGEARVQRAGFGRFACAVQALKDKRRRPGWTHREWCDGPGGLC